MHRILLAPEAIEAARASGALLVWHYARVSTPKDQKPERQLAFCQEWVARENSARPEARPPLVIVGTTWEKGVSGQKTWAISKMEETSPDPVRELFPLACADAKKLGCAALVVEQPDRASRREADEATWERMEVKRLFGLRIWTADATLAEQETSFGGVMRFWKQTKGNDDVKQLAPRVADGIRSRRRKGLPVGAQTRAKVDDSLVATVAAIKAANPRWGYRKIAHAASRERGAFEVDPGGPAFKERRVSHQTVKRILEGSSWHQTGLSRPGTVTRSRP